MQRMRFPWPRPVRRALLAGVVAGLSALSACQTGGSEPEPATTPVTVLAVGDIAQCRGQAPALADAARTAALIDAQGSDLPVLLLGDLAYDRGLASEYAGCYEPLYGRFKPRSLPAPGNHDWGVAGAAAYFDYFGSRAGPDRRGYYSLELGSWHIVSLDSNIDMGPGSAQEAWLRADLAAHRGQPCTLAFWHHPRFSSSDVHGDDPRSAAIWQALYESGADVVLAGHDHTYERFAPQNPSGAADAARGLREFVVGTGGAALYGFGPPRPNSEVRGQGAFGVLKLVLDDGRYEWEFLPAAGSSFTDRGQGVCVR